MFPSKRGGGSDVESKDGGRASITLLQDSGAQLKLIFITLFRKRLKSLIILVFAAEGVRKKTYGAAITSWYSICLLSNRRIRAVEWQRKEMDKEEVGERGVIAQGQLYRRRGTTVYYKEQTEYRISLLQPSKFAPFVASSDAYKGMQSSRLSCSCFGSSRIWSSNFHS